ncbi:tRNA (adenosine(37)-N6)-threonylcarbamoyltransferase complex dimerization subunit type 1 TsaB [Candidatus Saccharibacteria bacterium]|nr:tRNA (adenosine(37)-N6)-threonylcarbamoyltransferase complex dimerization subunit type 1 TsaB [Candidatus Saccharibacteria bacterium]
MKLYLDTSDQKLCILKLDDKTYEWEANKELAEKLLEFIKDKLEENNKTWQDIEEITFFSGPGSFTGLRIGAAVVNTLASELNIPLYDHHKNQHEIIIPDYGRPANIGVQKK